MAGHPGINRWFGNARDCADELSPGPVEHVAPNTRAPVVGNAQSFGQVVNLSDVDLAVDFGRLEGVGLVNRSVLIARDAIDPTGPGLCGVLVNLTDRVSAIAAVEVLDNLVVKDLIGQPCHCLLQARHVASGDTGANVHAQVVARAALVARGKLQDPRTTPPSV